MIQADAFSGLSKLLSGGQGTQAVHPVHDMGQTEMASCCAGPGDSKHGSVLSLL